MPRIIPITPHTLQRWTLPPNYAGAEWPDYYVFLGQHRDSDRLTRSNFIRGLELIGGESETVHVVREGHWGVGWVEWIAIHESDTQALELADEIAAALTDYPIVDEDHFSTMEFNEACDYWASLRVKDRLEYLEGTGISPFAARHDELPQDPYGRLYERLTAV